jgi:hypothetical protein
VVRPRRSGTPLNFSASGQQGDRQAVWQRSGFAGVRARDSNSILQKESIVRLAFLAALVLAGCADNVAAKPLPAAQAGSFFVAADGNDKWSGLLPAPNTTKTDGPFATLRQCQSAMRTSGRKTCSLRRGTYVITHTLVLTASDNDETWQLYEPDGYNTAVLDAGGAHDLTLDSVVLFNGVSNAKWKGIKIEHFPAYGILGSGGSGANPPAPVASGNIVEDSEIAFNTVTSWNSGCIYFFNDVPNTRISNNYCHDVGSQGIAINNWAGCSSGTGCGYDGAVISGNVILRAVQRMSDGGAIYMENQPDNRSIRATITNNFIRDYGSASLTNDMICIYLDQSTSNVTVSGNICGPPTAGALDRKNRNNTAAIFINTAGHKGTSINNVVRGNIIDLGTSSMMAIVDFGGPGTEVTGNIIISNFTGNLNTASSGATGVAYFQEGDAANFRIENNFYHNYAKGGLVFSNGRLKSDTHPVTGDPQLSGHLYAIAPESPVFKSPVNFAPIAGGWGPPGFVIPPSENHSH